MPVDILMVDKQNYLTVEPLLYQVATAGLGPEEIVYPLRGAVDDQPNLQYRLGTVTGAACPHQMDQQLFHQPKMCSPDPRFA